MTTAVPAASRRGRPSHLAGTRPLLKVSLHQDAKNIAPWVVIVTALSATSILAYTWVFDTPAERQQLAATLGVNPALSLIFGSAKDLSTPEGFNAWRAGQLGAFFAGLMAVLIVIRNSRANEDSGQAELIASGVIARGSRLAVAVAMAALASVLLGVACFVVTLICGGGVAATAIQSASFTASGLMFAGVAAVTAQLGSDARTASSLGVATLGVLYVLRGYLDVSGAPDWAIWLTPFGWVEETRPGTGNDPWPLLLALGLTVLLLVAAFNLQARRDFGQGLIATKPGPAEAGIAGNVWGLAVKLHGTNLVSWLVAFTGLGLLFGTLSTSMSDLLSANPAMAAILAAGATTASDLNFAFLVTILQIIAIIASVMGVQLVLSLYDEEINFRIEPLLAGSLRRRTYLAANALLALGSTAVALLVAGTMLGIVAHYQDSAIETGDVIMQAGLTVIAVWVLVGLAVAAIGAAPSRRVIGWVGVVATFGLTILGPTFNLPEWVLDLSPLRHVPNVSAVDPAWSELAWIGLIALALLGVGFVGFRRRDIV